MNSRAALHFLCLMQRLTATRARKSSRKSSHNSIRFSQTKPIFIARGAVRRPCGPFHPSLKQNGAGIKLQSSTWSQLTKPVLHYTENIKDRSTPCMIFSSSQTARGTMEVT